MGAQFHLVLPARCIEEEFDVDPCRPLNFPSSPAFGRLPFQHEILREFIRESFFRSAQLCLLEVLDV